MIAHLDLDAFYAAVEQRDRPELRGIPLVVGGDPHGRGVVATASYEARAYGIRSAMSAAEALRRCPHATFVRPDFERYRACSREVWAIVHELVTRVEQVGIDEGYLDLAPQAEGVPAVRALLAGLQASVLAATQLGCSLGCGSSKTVAKIASDREKPRGLVLVPPGEEAAFLAPLPLRLLPGIGPRAEERCARAAVRSIGDLAALGDDALSAVIGGKVGVELRDRARGVDRRTVSTEPAAPVSLGSEETFERDLVSLADMDAWLDRLARGLWPGLERRDLRARTVTTKLRYSDFAIVTRSQTLAEPVESPDALVAHAQRLLRRALDTRADPIRLLGVYVSRFDDGEAPGQQLRLPLELSG